MKWDLTYFFKTEEEYEQAYESLKPYVEKIASYNGQLSDEAKFVEYFLLQKEFEELAGKVYQYSSLKSDLNKKNVENASKVARIAILFQQLNQVSAFEDPEVLSLGKEKVMSIVDNHPELEEFRFGFEKLFRSTEHVLDANSEKLLSYYGPVSAGGELYSALAVADGKNQTVKLKNKEVYREEYFASKIHKDYIKELKAKKIYIYSQVHAVGFYEKLGFIVEGDIFYEEDHPHKKVYLDL